MVFFHFSGFGFKNANINLLKKIKILGAFCYIEAQMVGYKPV